MAFASRMQQDRACPSCLALASYHDWQCCVVISMVFSHFLVLTSLDHITIVIFACLWCSLFTCLVPSLLSMVQIKFATINASWCWTRIALKATSTSCSRPRGQGFRCASWVLSSHRRLARAVCWCFFFGTTHT